MCAPVAWRRDPSTPLSGDPLMNDTPRYRVHYANVMTTQKSSLVLRFARKIVKLPPDCHWNCSEFNFCSGYDECEARSWTCSNQSNRVTKRRDSIGHS